MSSVWWGTYPAAGLGTPTGLGEGVWRQDPAAATQVLELPAPSFVLGHPSLPVLYAVSEAPTTQVHAIDVSAPLEPRLLASIGTGGDSGCHLLLARDARTLYVSHYASGTLAVVPLHTNGQFALAAPSQVFGHAGSGPRADRQESPHAHFAGYAPGDQHILVADLGTDQLRRYRAEPDGSLSDNGIAATLPPGSGPRHFAVRGNLIYLVCELDHRLRTLRWDAAAAAADVIAEAPTTNAPLRTGDTIYDAHIELVEGGPAGDVLLVSVRGADVISVFDLSPEGEARYRGCFDAGAWPRHFAVVGDSLMVGAERGHEVRTYALSDVLGLAPEAEVGGIGLLASTTAAVTSPACVATTR